MRVNDQCMLARPLPRSAHSLANQISRTGHPAGCGKISREVPRVVLC